MIRSMRHRAMLMACALLAILSACSAPREQRLVVAGYGGAFEDILRTKVFPQFERAHGIRIDYLAGNSTNTLARLYAQRSNQQIDVAIIDDGPMYKAIAFGLCQRIDELPEGEILPIARIAGDRAVGIGVVATGIMYNKRAFAERGWDAPTSWEDLKDPKYRGLLVIPPLNNTYGMHALVHFARAGGGGESNIQPGFETFQRAINPNVLVYEPSPGKMSELFSSGQALISLWGSGRVKLLADTGLPVAFVYPSEGAYALLSAICPTSKPKSHPLAQEFVRYMVSAQVQETLAATYGSAPVNQRARVIDNDVVPLPIGHRAEQMNLIDWSIANLHRDQWDRRWTREIER